MSGVTRVRLWRGLAVGIVVLAYIGWYERVGDPLLAGVLTLGTLGLLWLIVQAAAWSWNGDDDE